MLFRSARYGHVFIDVNGSRPDVQVRDWETGDKSGSLEQWVIDHNEASGKKDAVVYCNRSTIPEVRSLTGSQVLGQDYFLWVSTLDGTVYTGEGVIACQNKGESLTGGHWDSSVVFNTTWWQADAPKTVVAAPTTDDIRAIPNCEVFQNAVRTTADGLWGTETDKHAQAVISATKTSFPFGVLFVQTIVVTTADGIWGPKS